MTRSASANLFDLVAARAAARPDKLALETGDAFALAYGALIDRSGRAASALVALEVKPGDRVAAQIDKSPDAIVLALACLRAGAALLPLNMAYTLAELDYFLSDAEPALTLCRPDLLASARELTSKLGLPAAESLGVARDGTFAEKIAAAAPDFETVPRAASDLAAILYTSGTTGRSKGAMLTHENLASNALTLVETWRFTAADRLIHALPVFHTHGLFVAVNVALLSGATMIFLNRFDPDAIIVAMPGATSLMGVPTYYTRLLDHPGLTRGRLRHHAPVRVRLGAAARRDPRRLARAHRPRHPRALRHDRDQHDHVEPLRRRAQGRARSGSRCRASSVRIAEAESDAPAAAGEIGVIEVKGPNVFAGYWRMPEKTAQEFRPTATSSPATWGASTPDGYVHIVGRAKDLVISGGFNVYPKEVEGELDCARRRAGERGVRRPAPDFGEGVTAVVVPQARCDAHRSRAHRRAWRLGWRAFKAPKRVFVVRRCRATRWARSRRRRCREEYKDIYRG